MNLFRYETYKDILIAQIASNPGGRGYRTKLAEAAGCQLSFLSQVIHSHVHLTPDHAAGLCEYWGFDNEERDYFLELVNLARAGSPILKTILLKRLAEIRAKHEDLASRYKKRESIREKDQALYYSSWHLSAIHILLTISEFRTVEEIAKRLSLPPSMVQQSLQQLTRIGLAVRKSGVWLPTENDLHLPKDSPFTSMNHSNWRHRATLDSCRREKGGVHYTTVHSVSRSDFEKIKEMALRFLDQTRAVVRTSPEEEVTCMTLDWFVI